MAKETVFLIHGTFSGEPSKAGTEPKDRKWWERGSPFWDGLHAALEAEQPGRFELTDRFVWGDGGKNSETLRRQGGKDLLEEIKKLEQGQSFHLVAHSHGGSVIWHALVEAKLQKLELTGLKSWTTVGTPFLRFVPSNASLWLIAPFSVSLFALLWFGIAWPLPIPAFGRAWTWADGPIVFIGLIGLLLTLAILIASFVLATSHLIAQLIEIVDDRRRRVAERAAIHTYGPLHLALTHRDDEPKNGIGLSTYRPGHIWPRPTVVKSHGWLRRKLTALARVVSEIWARPIDDLAWQAVARRVQGDDHPYLDLGAVSTAPYGFASRRVGYNTVERSTIGNDADKNTLHIGRRLRNLLRRVARRPNKAIELAVLRDAVDWRGIIHTSYFDHPFTMVRISENLLRAKRRKVTQSDIEVTRYWPRALTLALGGTSAAGLALVALVTGLAFQTWVLPYSEQGLLVAVVETENTDPLVINAENGDWPGHLSLRLQRLAEAELTRPFGPAAIEAPPKDFNMRMRSAQVRAYWLASPQGGNDLAAVDEYVKTFPDDAIDSLMMNYYLQSMAIWSRVRDRTPEEAEAIELWRRAQLIAPQNSIEFGQGQKVIQSLVQVVLAAQLEKPIEVDASSPVRNFWDCGRSGLVALALIDIVEPRRAAELAANCTPGRMAEANLLLIGHLHGNYPVGDLGRFIRQMEIDDESAAEIFENRPTIECIMQSDNRARFGLLRRELLDVALKLFVDNKPQDAIGALSTIVVWAEQTQLWADSLLAMGKASPRDLQIVVESQYEELVWSLLKTDMATLIQITKGMVGTFPDLDFARALAPALPEHENWSGDFGPAFVELAKSFVSTGDDAAGHLNAVLAALPADSGAAAALGLAVADEALRINDEGLWASAVDIARKHAFAARASQQRVGMLRRLAKAEVRSGNFPEALRIAGLASNADDHAHDLIAISDSLLCRVGDRDSCSGTAFPPESHIPSDWADLPTSDLPFVEPVRPVDLKQCVLPPQTD
jgi:hypothetical protein